MNSHDYAARLTRSYANPDRPAMTKVLANLPLAVLKMLHASDVRVEIVPSDEPWPVEVPVGFDRASGIYLPEEHLIHLKSPQAVVIAHVVGHTLDVLGAERIGYENGALSASATPFGDAARAVYAASVEAGTLPTKLAGTSVTEFMAECLRCHFGFVAPRFADPLASKPLTAAQKALAGEFLAELDLSPGLRMARPLSM